MKESYIERKVCEYAKSLGWMVFKFNSPGKSGVPDRIFMKKGKIVFIEFKAAGKRPTKLQLHIHREMENAGFHVHVVDNILSGKEIFDAIENLSEGGSGVRQADSPVNARH